MGTPIPEPTPGVNCLNWDPPAETPKYVYVTFYEVKKGDLFGAFQPPNLHIFKMEQVDGLPCHWQYLDTTFGWEAYLGIDAGQCWIWLRDLVHVGADYFVDTKPISPPAEYELFTNDYLAPAGNWGYGGYCFIFWLPTVISLAESFGLEPLDVILLEMSATANTDIVHKFCSLMLRTNIKIKYSP